MSLDCTTVALQTKKWRVANCRIILPVTVNNEEHLWFASSSLVWWRQYSLHIHLNTRTCADNPHKKKKPKSIHWLTRRHTVKHIHPPSQPENANVRNIHRFTSFKGSLCRRRSGSRVSCLYIRKTREERKILMLRRQHTLASVHPGHLSCSITQLPSAGTSGGVCARISNHTPPVQPHCTAGRFPGNDTSQPPLSSLLASLCV